MTLPDFVGAKKALEVIEKIPTVAKQKAHIDFLNDQLKFAQEEIAKLKEERAELLQESQRLSRLLHELEAKEQFVDGGVCLFRKSNGKINDTPLCHKCKLPMSHVDPQYWMCSGCEAIFAHTEIQAAKRKIQQS